MRLARVKKVPYVLFVRCHLFEPWRDVEHYVLLSVGCVGGRLVFSNADRRRNGFLGVAAVAAFFVLAGSAQAQVVCGVSGNGSDTPFALSGAGSNAAGGNFSCGFQANSSGTNATTGGSNVAVGLQVNASG